MSPARALRATVAMLAVVTLALTSAPASAAPSLIPGTAAVAPPEQDPFYTPPSPLPNGAPGTILRSREATVSAYGLPVPTDAWQVLYLSRDAKGTPVADVATILVPQVPQVPYSGGERPLLSYQTAADSLALHCAPSYTMREGTEKEFGLITLGLAQGWAVVVPDYEGPESQYGPGRQAGRAVLDGVRAALAFEPAGLNADTPVGMWGYSGGGLATAWASELRHAYAPEVNLAGVAQGGVPPTFEPTARMIDGGPFAGFYFAVSIGLDRAYPEMRIESILNDKGRAMVADLGSKCSNETVQAGAFHKMSEYTTVEDPLTLRRMQRILAINTLGQHTPTAPVYSYHSINDELIPIGPLDELIDEYCAEGVTVQHYRDAASEHVALAVTGAPAAVRYLAGRFSGAPAPSTC